MPPYRPDRIYGTQAAGHITAPFPTCPEYAMCGWGFTIRPGIRESKAFPRRINYQGEYWLKYINGLCRIHSPR